MLADKPSTTHNIYVEPRTRLINWVRDQLIGPPTPVEGDRILVGVNPIERFPCGALYPTSPWGEGIDPADTESDEVTEITAGENAEGEQSAEPVAARRYTPPSSLGFSFFITGEGIRLQVLYRACRYKLKTKATETNKWSHEPLVTGSEDEEYRNILCPYTDMQQNYAVLQDSARLNIRWRHYANGWIVTVSLCNTQKMPDPIKENTKSVKEYVNDRAERTLFEAGLRCVIESGEVGAYPRIDRSLLDEEEQEIELQYAKRHVYAIGHGCAADWKVENGVVTELRSDPMPVVEVPQMTADTGAASVPSLSLARLAIFDQTHEEQLTELRQFIDDYASWVAGQQERIPYLNGDDQPAANRIIKRMKTAVSRMHTGLRLLTANGQIRLAFALANQAMLDQMRQHDRLQEKARRDEAYRWRPFQLAFLLTTLESVVCEDSEFRDTVDLIWFPTGGGKTEAYLGLIAFQILLRRLRHPDTGGGTAVLMRYTLRLLARDQFMRATRLICALELIRRCRSNQDLGKTPISIGMWVGAATSPNTFKDATKLLDDAKTSGKKPALVLDQCPWCGNPFHVATNYRCEPSRFHYLCHNPACDFGASDDEVLPCNIVDEALYAEPPTMLVATADKFARLAWEERANAFFGGTANLPPELIIQDELHLIAGALGSVAGLYEAALDSVIKLRGIHPKYIASTATIRMAQQQVKLLYGRDLAIFPPPGLDCDDSFFARTVPLSQRPGRIYVGYLAPLLNRQQCMAPLAAALMQAPLHLFRENQDAKEILDAWWTQMVYHGSLKGVGNSHTAFISDVSDFTRLINTVKDPVDQQPEERSPPVIAQLTSLQTAEENAEIFARLKTPQSETGALDAVLATNMISVGLDVARLALMVINGQPLTTADYIQASSRVGRSDVPGVVFTNYYRNQARSLSHYESFRPFHEAFYRFVEPTSVTPYTYQARMRALHAALVIVIRHAKLGLLANHTAGDLVPDSPPVAAAIDLLAWRCRQAAGDDLGKDVSEHLIDLARAWGEEAQRCQHVHRQLSYQVPDQDAGKDRLLYNHQDRIRGLWPTLQSMRHVENTALIKVI